MSRPMGSGVPLKRFLVVGAAIGLALSVAAAFYLLSRPTPPSRGHLFDDLEANYRTHTSEFRTVAALSSVNATFGIDVRTGRLAAEDITSRGVPHYSEILSALKAVGASRVSASHHEVQVTAASKGLAVSGRESGYYFSTASDLETVTPEVARSPKAPEMWFCPLGDSWYASDYRF